MLSREGRHLHQHLGELQISNIMPMEINLEEHFQTIEVGVRDGCSLVTAYPKALIDKRHEKFRINMQRLMEKLDRNKSFKSSTHKFIDKLWQIYDIQYKTRFSSSLLTLESEA